MNEEKELNKRRIYQKIVKVFAKSEYFQRGHKKDFMRCPANIFCSKSAIQTLEKDVKYVQR